MVELIGRRSVSFSGNAEAEDELSDESSQLGEKKRRLNMEQVRTLEKNFELGNKLEPERKIQLARALGLQPRQIAIWFQNRRARWKTKQLEKDYDLLRRRFDAIKADNDSLQSQNKRLQAEVNDFCKKKKEIFFFSKSPLAFLNLALLDPSESSLLRPRSSMIGQSSLRSSFLINYLLMINFLFHFFFPPF